MTGLEKILRLWNKHPYQMTLKDYYDEQDAWKQYEREEQKRCPAPGTPTRSN